LNASWQRAEEGNGTARSASALGKGEMIIVNSDKPPRNPSRLVSLHQGFLVVIKFNWSRSIQPRFVCLGLAAMDIAQVSYSNHLSSRIVIKFTWECSS
jgi:hypothetical protein